MKVAFSYFEKDPASFLPCIHGSCLYFIHTYLHALEIWIRPFTLLECFLMARAFSHLWIRLTLASVNNNKYIFLPKIKPKPDKKSETLPSWKDIATVMVGRTVSFHEWVMSCLCLIFAQSSVLTCHVTGAWRGQTLSYSEAASQWVICFGMRAKQQGAVGVRGRSEVWELQEVGGYSQATDSHFSSDIKPHRPYAASLADLRISLTINLV